MNAARGGRHTGQDLNGIGGENTDEGLPVRAAGRGLLIYAGSRLRTGETSWFCCIGFPDGRFVQSLYAHLKTISDIPLGTIGRGSRSAPWARRTAIIWLICILK